MVTKIINIQSLPDCNMLIERLCKTLGTQKPNVLKSIYQQVPPQFIADDRFIFEGLCKAIFSSDTGWESIETKWAQICNELWQFDIDKVAHLSKDEIKRLYENNIKPLGLKLKEKQFEYINRDAQIFLNIQNQHDSFGKYIQTFLVNNHLGNLVLKPEMENEVITTFTNAIFGKWKLHGVGLPIFSEFCKNVGIDEFKADRHVKRFFSRLRLLNENAVNDDYGCRQIGIIIANTTGKPRSFIDSLIWNFCADYRGEICRHLKKHPKCNICFIKYEEPSICYGPLSSEHNGHTRSMKVRGGTMNQTDQLHLLEIYLTKEEFGLIESMAKRVLIKPESLAESWIKEKLNLIHNQPIPPSSNGGSPSNEPNNDVVKKRKFMNEIAEALQSEEKISSGKILKKLFKKYPEFEDKTNPLIVADYAANSTSGYPSPKKDSTKHPCPVLFRVAHNTYIKYDESIHSKYICVLDKHGKKVLKRV